MSWKKVKLGDVLIHKESRFKPYDERISSLKRIDKIDFFGNIYLSDSASKTDMIVIETGDLVISGINVHKGAIAIYEGIENIIATIHYSNYKIKNDNIDLNFLKLFLKSPEFLDAIKEQVPGGIKTEIKPKHLLPILIKIPDLSKQKDIVKSFINIENHQNSLNNELSHQLNLIKQLRQQILQDAVQGKLVRQDPNDEPASILLKKIKDEKAQLAKEKKSKKEKPMPPIKAEDIPFDIPENWVWCRLGEIITFGPVNGYSPKESQLGRGIKCLTLTATTSGNFNEKYFKFVDMKIEFDSYLWLCPEDILLQRGNSLEYVGIAALYNGPENTFIYPDLMIKIRASQLINSKYLHFLLNSPFSRSYFQSKASGSQKSMPKICQHVVTESKTPLPPLPEQHRIVAKTEQLMRQCDELEAAIKQNQTYTDQLLQAALREALQDEG